MVKRLGGMMDQWVLGILGSASVFLCLIGLLLVPVYGNTEGLFLNFTFLVWLLSIKLKDVDSFCS